MLLFFKEKSKLNWLGSKCAKEIYNILLNFKIQKQVNKNWNYLPSFIGVDKYLQEQNFDKNNINIIIDNEHNTYNEGKKIFNNIEQKNSEKEFGLRVADILIGIISRLSTLINKQTDYLKNQAKFGDNYLDFKFFDLNENQFKGYKLLYELYFLLNNSWNKQYSSTYTETLSFLSFLKYINRFKNFLEYKNKKNFNSHQIQEAIYSFKYYQQYVEEIEKEEIKKNKPK